MMAEEFENPLGLTLDEHGIATDINELREIAHHAARGFLAEAMANPFFVMVPGMDYMLGFMQYLHDVTCPSNADIEHWVDLQARLDDESDANAEKAIGVQDEEPTAPLNPLLADQLRHILGGEG